MTGIYNGNFQTTTAGLNEAAKLLNDAIEKRAAALDPSKIITAFDVVGGKFRDMEKRNRKRNTANLTRWLKTLSPKEREQLLLQGIDPIGEVANSWSPIDVEDANLTGAWDTAISDATAFAKERNLRAQDTLTPEQIDEIYGSGRDIVSELGAGDQYLDLGDKELRENYKKRQDEAAKRLTGKRIYELSKETPAETEARLLGLTKDNAPALMQWDDTNFQERNKEQRSNLESIRSAEFALDRNRLSSEEQYRQAIEGVDPLTDAGPFVRADNENVKTQLGNEVTTAQGVALQRFRHMLGEYTPSELVNMYQGNYDLFAAAIKQIPGLNLSDKEIQDTWNSIKTEATKQLMVKAASDNQRKSFAEQDAESRSGKSIVSNVPEQLTDYGNPNLLLEESNRNTLVRDNANAKSRIQLEGRTNQEKRKAVENGTYLTDDYATYSGIETSTSNIQKTVQTADQAMLMGELKTLSPRQLADAILAGEGTPFIQRLLNYKYANANDKDVQTLIDNAISLAKADVKNRQEKGRNNQTDKDIIDNGVFTIGDGTVLSTNDSSTAEKGAMESFASRKAKTLSGKEGRNINPESSAVDERIYDKSESLIKDKTTADAKEYVRKILRDGTNNGKSVSDLVKEYYDKNQVPEQYRETPEYWSNAIIADSNKSITLKDNRENYRDKSPSQFAKEVGNMANTNPEQYVKNKEAYISVNKERIVEGALGKKEYEKLVNDSSYGQEQITEVTLKALKQIDKYWKDKGKLNSIEHEIAQEALLAGIASATKNNINATKAAVEAYKRRKNDAQNELAQKNYHFSGSRYMSLPETPRMKKANANDQIRNAITRVLAERGVLRFASTPLLQDMAGETILERFRNVDGLSFNDMKENPKNFAEKLIEQINSAQLDDLGDELALYQKIWATPPDAVQKETQEAQGKR